MSKFRCPRCGHTEIHGNRRTLSAAEPNHAGRTVEEYFCPKCELLEIADSDQADYATIMARWRLVPDDLAARSKKLANTILEALDEPEDPERAAELEQKERDDREALEKFYTLTGQKPTPRNGGGGASSE